MKAVLVRQPGDAQQLYITETAAPVAGPGEVLVRVKAAALNRMDILQREGNYPLPPGASEILGVDMAGVVEQGDGKWQPGDEVFGLLQGGGYAEYATIESALLWPKPAELSFEEAAAVPEVFMTAWQCLFWLGRAQAGDRVLVHAGASGVGTAALQLLRERGITAFATAGSADKVAYCQSLGAAEAFDYREGEFAGRLLAGADGVDVILDFVGASYWDQNLQCLNLDGRLILISFLGGAVVERANLGLLLRKRLSVIGTTLRSRSSDYRARLAGELGAFALPRFADGRLRPIVDTVFAMEAVKDAHRMMEANRNTGKLVLRIG